MINNNVLEQQTNFKNFEDKLGVLLDKCNKKTFTDMFEDINTGVLKARVVKQYTLEE